MIIREINEEFTRGDLIKFDLGRKRNDIHNGIIMRARNGKYTVRDENGDNIEISDEMIIEKLEQVNESVDTMPKRFFPDFDFAEPEYKVSPPHKMNESLLDEKRMNLGDPWHHWTEVYNIFETISDMYPVTSSSGNIANQKVNAFYDIFKGIRVVDQAYDKWMNR